MKHTHEIEEYIESLKENALKLTAGIVTVATIATGSLALTACDNTQRVNASETTTQTTTTEVVTNDITTEETNEEVTTEETTTEEITTNSPPKISKKETALLKMLIKDYPEFESGLYGFNISISPYGDGTYKYGLTAMPNGNDDSFGYTTIGPVGITKECYDEMMNDFEDRIIQYNKYQLILERNSLTSDELEYLCSMYKDLYLQKNKH